MKLSYEYKRASEVTPDEEKYIKTLQIEDIGLIWYEFKTHRKERTCYVLLVKTSRNTTIAWGLIFKNFLKREWEFSVYVKKSYRRKGIGSRIYRKMKQKLHLKNGVISVFRHDNRSISFFNKLQKRD